MKYTPMPEISASFGTVFWRPAKALWNRQGLVPRDSLRFEANMPLYGHELDEDITPLEALLGKFVALDKEEDLSAKKLCKSRKQKECPGE